MADEARSPGWWLASDGRWYPPHLHPGHAASAAPAWWQASDGRWYPPEAHPTARGSLVERPSPVDEGAEGTDEAPAEGVEGATPELVAAAGEVPASLSPTLLGEHGAHRLLPRLAFSSAVSDSLGRWALPLQSAYVILGVLVLAYVVSVAARDGHATSRLLDGWGADALELLGSTLCLARAAVRRPGRGVALALGLGVLGWALGDTLVTLQNRATPSLPADICYLAFYPLAYWAIVLLMRQQVAKVGVPAWLDGAVAGLGAAALCAAFAFRGPMAGATALTTAMNLAYPVGDALLLALAVGGTAILGGHRRATWVLVALACAINAVGDTFNLLHSSVGASAAGESFNATAWPVAILLMSIAMWVGLEQSVSPTKDGVTPGLILPGLAAAAGLCILTVGCFHTIVPIAVALAAAALVAAGVRMAIAVVTQRSMALQRHRQSMTDELTGLGNRRYLAHVFDALVGESVPIDQPLGVLFVDLDGFKEVNDSFGHSAGDHVLRQVGPRLAGCLRRTDVLVRLGGDEFAILLPGVDATQASMVAEVSPPACGRRSPSTTSPSRSAPASASPWPPRTPPTSPSCCAAPTPPCTAPRSPEHRSSSTTSPSTTAATCCASWRSCASRSSRASSCSTSSRSWTFAPARSPRSRRSCAGSTRGWA